MGTEMLISELTSENLFKFDFFMIPSCFKNLLFFDHFSNIMSLLNNL